MLTILAVAAAVQVCFGCPTGPAPPKTRISDGKWSVQVVLQEGVTKSEAEVVARAFHRGELVDKHPLFPGDAPGTYLPPVSEANAIGAIGVATPAQFHLPDAPGRFLFVTTYRADSLSGRKYLVAIRDGRVELLASLLWMT